MRIYLIGLSGAGKSTLAQQAAALLNIGWFDTDAAVERGAGMRIGEIFRTQGETVFRTLECAAVRQASTLPANVLVATGGGAVLSAENRALMRQSGVCVHVVRTLAETLQTLDESRPLLKQNAEQMLRRQALEREPLYAALAALTFENQGSMEQAAAALAALLRPLLTEG